jgi:hypothetical protein
LHKIRIGRPHRFRTKNQLDRVGGTAPLDPVSAISTSAL